MLVERWAFKSLNAYELSLIAIILKTYFQDSNVVRTGDFADPKLPLGIFTVFQTLQCE